jgi:lipoprotein-anchoring transpeptidase ErfK/SrfK
VLKPLLIVAVVLTLQAQVPTIAPRVSGPLDALALQVALDRAGYSPGVIDGQPGKNTARALDAYIRQFGQEPPLPPQALKSYQITDADAAGPYVERIPSDLMEQAALEQLAYTDVVEALAERFHTTPSFLRRVNPGSQFAANETVQVPDVEAFLVPAPRLEGGDEGETRPKGTSGRTPAAAKPVEPPKPDVTVTVSASAGTLVVSDASGRTIFFAPVTTGSARDPLPPGEWKITGVQFGPQFRYNPELFWDADPAHTKATIAPGPNNPVGVVWIDLTKDHYGLHGTPEPSRVGRVESHGCVRLTNWDATRVAGLVKPGTRVVFTP